MTERWTIDNAVIHGQVFAIKRRSSVPFAPGSKGATNATSREGLGTSIVESLAKQLDAEVDRESTSRGTVVTICHPRTAAVAPA